MIGRVIARGLLAVAVVLAAAVDAGAQAALTANLTSSVLGEVRAYTVRLPDGYAREPQRRHPVVYVLDGPPLDEHTAQGARPLAAAGQAPGLIVVGIPNMQRSGRARDFLPPFLSFARRDGSPFTGGADRFLRFLREELVPRIERDYRTMRPRLVVGHSLGAIFVSYSVGAAPSFFDARFAHSPAIWRDEDAIAADLARSLSSARGLGSFFYLSVGEKEGGGLGDGYAKLHTVLRTHAAAAGLRWRAEVTPGAVHETNVARATPSALRAYFAGLASPKR
jgi:predicted alpha/beta superfamily hydrolase